MEFRDELPPGKGGYRKGGAGEAKYKAEADELRQHPGEWGLVTTFTHDKGASARSTAVNAQNGRLAAFRPKGAFLASTRTTADGVNLWVCYTGKES